MATGTLTQKDEFKNVTTGWLGVVLIDGRGDHRGFPVEPGGTVWLSEEEQIATANAPRSDLDNPFLKRDIPLYDDGGDQVGTEHRSPLELVTVASEVRNRRPYGAVAQPITAAEPEPEPAPEETGATPVPAEEPEVGSAAPGEEVATPAAARAPRRRKATA